MIFVVRARAFGDLGEVMGGVFRVDLIFHGAERAARRACTVVLAFQQALELIEHTLDGIILLRVLHSYVPGWFCPARVVA